MPDVTYGEPRLLARPINERLRDAQPGSGMFIVQTPSGVDALRLPSRTVAAGPACSARVAADMHADGDRQASRCRRTEQVDLRGWTRPMPLSSAWLGGQTVPRGPAGAAHPPARHWRCRRSAPLSGLHRSCLRTGCGLVGHCQVPGPPCQCLAPPGDVIIGKEPSGEFVGRTEEALEAETEEPLIVPVAGNDAFIQEGEGQAYGHVLQLGHAARDGDKIHHDLFFPCCLKPRLPWASVSGTGLAWRHCRAGACVAGDRSRALAAGGDCRAGRRGVHRAGLAASPPAGWRQGTGLRRCPEGPL